MRSRGVGWDGRDRSSTHTPSPPPSPLFCLPSCSPRVGLKEVRGWYPICDLERHVCGQVKVGAAKFLCDTASMGDGALFPTLCL